MQFLPENDKVTPSEICRVVNEILRSQGFSNPIINDRIGQAEPPAQYLRKGLPVYADGSTWNPGSGEGYYYRKSDGSWVFLG